MKKKLMIEGMSCGHCVMHVKNALTELEGVKGAEVSLDDKMAMVDMDNEIEDTLLKAAVDEAGYEVVNVEII